jgi:hypothetical protein
MSINLIWDHTPKQAEMLGRFITEHEKAVWAGMTADFESHLLFGNKYMIATDPALDGPSKSLGMWAQINTSGMILDSTRMMVLDFGSGNSEDPFIATAKKKCVFLTININ